MKVLVIGSGGREHAIVWKCLQSPRVSKVYCAPGNGGIGQEVESVPIAADRVDELLAFAKREAIDLTIVGPEQSLVLGIVDRFLEAGLKIWGPSQAASQLEGSKRFAKDFMRAHGIPTAAYGTFQQLESALSFLKTLNPPYVVKADGLAAGKGVIIASTLAEAEDAVRGMLCEARFGEAGRQVVIEDYIDGEEASFIAVCDGVHAVPFASSQDHKRLRDGDQGPNTGGMGAYSPAPILDATLEARAMSEIVMPLLKGMRDRGTPYRGFLYAGLMIDSSRNFRVLEFNCRLGDPETQPLLFRLESDLIDVILAGLQGRLDTVTLQFTPGSAACVVLAAQGYPGDYVKGTRIEGIPQATDRCKVFHAGTLYKDGHYWTHGGRVLGVTAKGNDLQAALATAYQTVKEIHWDGMVFRRDIGQKGLR